MGERKSARIIRVGIIGTGWVATARHIPSYRRDRRAKTVAILDHDRKKADSVARKFGVPSSFDSLDAFLRQDLDVVSICTPPQGHASLARAAMKTGKHVLVEKPMTMTPEEGQLLEEISHDSGRILCPAHNFRFSRTAQKADKILSSGEAGQVQWAMGIQLSSWQRRLPDWFSDLPGGLFFDEAPHLLYLMKHFLGDIAIEQSWQTGEAGDLQHRMETRLRGQHGTSYLTMWFGAPFSEWLLILFCSRAVLVLDLFRDILINLPPEEGHNASDVLKTSLQGTLRFWNGVGASGIRAARNQFLFGHDLLIKQFLDSVIEGKRPPVSPREGWEVISLIEEILNQNSPVPCLV